MDGYQRQQFIETQHTRLEGTSRIVWSNLSWQNMVQARWPSTLFSRLAEVSNVGESTTSLATLFQWLIVLIS